MKLFNYMVNKRRSIFIVLIVFLLVVTSCDRNNKKPEKNSYETTIEEESITNPDMVYRYDGVGSMRFGEYFKLHDNQDPGSNP